MWSWILLILIPIISFAIFEETIYFIVYRVIFGSRKERRKMSDTE